MSWSSKQQRQKKFFYFTGTGYPSVEKGANKTQLVTSNRESRESFYHDPAVKISDANLDEWNGIQGYPLCIEHNDAVVVGEVKHTWLSDDRRLQVMARIPLPEGERVVADIKAGKYTGFSVGYGNDIVEKDNREYIAGKRFREISLVAEPFFEGCRLSYGVEATGREKKKEFSNPAYKSNAYIYCSIDEKTFRVMEESNTTTPAPPQGVSPEEMLREAARLKEHNDDSDRRVKELEAKLKQHEEELDRHRKREEEERQLYEKEQLPKYEAYALELKASGGATDETVKPYRMIFCDPRLKDQAKVLEAQYKSMVELKASKLQMEEKLKAAEKEKAEWQAAGQKSTEVINASNRERIANALKEETKPMTTADVNAGLKLDLGHIMMPNPTAKELEFMQMSGFHHYSSTDVSASSRPAPRTVKVEAGSHRNLYDEHRNPKLPASMRNQPGSNILFAFMSQNSAFRDADLSGLVRITEDTTLEKILN